MMRLEFCRRFAHSTKKGQSHFRRDPARRGAGIGTVLCLFLAFVVIFWAAAGAASAASPTTVLLWPDGAPGAKGNRPADKPTLTVFLPDAAKANGAAVVICPGGGYGGLALGHEGHDIAVWLNSFGVAGFILEYRHRGKGYGHPAPLEDAQRAIRTVRVRASQWKINPARIGIMGFSAGGHLASTAATHFDRGDPAAADPDRARQLPAGFRHPLLRRHRLRRTLHASRLADQPARQRRSRGAGAQPIEREAGDEGDAADVPLPHR